jgi:hypothetical protein
MLPDDRPQLANSAIVLARVGAGLVRQTSFLPAACFWDPFAELDPVWTDEFMATAIGIYGSGVMPPVQEDELDEKLLD